MLQSTASANRKQATLPKNLLSGLLSPTFKQRHNTISLLYTNTKYTINMTAHADIQMSEADAMAQNAELNLFEWAALSAHTDVQMTGTEESNAMALFRWAALAAQLDNLKMDLGRLKKDVNLCGLMMDIHSGRAKQKAMRGIKRKRGE